MGVLRNWYPAILSFASRRLNWEEGFSLGKLPPSLTPQLGYSY